MINTQCDPIEHFETLRKTWEKSYRNLNGLKLTQTGLLVNRFQTSNCGLRFTLKSGSRSPQAYPWGCVGSYISAKLNASVPDENLPILDNQRPKIYFRFSKWEDEIESRKHFIIEKRNTDKTIWEHYCTYRRPFPFKIFVHKNATKLDLVSAAASTFNLILTCFVITSVVFIALIYFFALKITLREQNYCTKTASLLHVVCALAFPLVNQIDLNFIKTCNRVGTLFKFGITFWLMLAMLISSLHSGKFISLLTVKDLPSIPRNLKEILTDDEKYSNFPVITTSGAQHDNENFLKTVIKQLLNMTANDDNNLVKDKNLYCSLYLNLVTKVLTSSINRHVLITSITYSINIPVWLHKCTNFTLSEKIPGTLTFPPIFGLLDYIQDVHTISRAVQDIGQYAHIPAMDSLTSDDIQIGHGNTLCIYETKFISSYVHELMGRIDNMGIYQRWIDQFVYHLELTDRVSLKGHYKYEAALFNKKRQEKLELEEHANNLGLMEIWVVFELCMGACLVAAFTLILEIFVCLNDHLKDKRRNATRPWSMN